jgi:hypothetical protein
MTGNKFAGETCAYCCTQPSDTDDHVFALKFFVEEQRPNLVQVPACSACNNAKSKLEGGLMVVLGFAGRHADADTNLSKLVAHRLENKANARIARDLRAGTTAVWVVENGVLRRGMSVPVDWSKVGLLFCFIARGLAWHHFDKLQLGDDCSVGIVSMLGRDGDVMRQLLNANARRRIECDVGQRTFHYRGVQAADNPTITAWEFSIYGGIRTVEGGDQPDNIGVLTGPKVIVDKGRNTGALLDQWRKGTRLHR